MFHFFSHKMYFSHLFLLKRFIPHDSFPHDSFFLTEIHINNLCSFTHYFFSPNESFMFACRISGRDMVKSPRDHVCFIYLSNTVHACLSSTSLIYFYQTSVWLRRTDVCLMFVCFFGVWQSVFCQTCYQSESFLDTKKTISSQVSCLKDVFVTFTHAKEKSCQTKVDVKIKTKKLKAMHVFWSLCVHPVNILK